MVPTCRSWAAVGACHRVRDHDLHPDRPADRVYRLATTLLDHHRYPAGELITLYHRRWEIETAYLELKSSILGGRVLRARTPTRIEQEVYALLVVYHLLHTAMADATSTRPDVDPDRASFTIAWQTARDQVIQAAGVIADTVIDLVGTIGRHALADLMPARRLRVCPASSNAPSPSTRPVARSSTEPVTRPP